MEDIQREHFISQLDKAVEKGELSEKEARAELRQFDCDREMYTQT